MARITGLEARRQRAAQLLGEGMSQKQVAGHCGVSRQTVNGWAQVLAREGPAGLRIRRLGRKPRLTEDELHEIARLLRSGPIACGLREAAWTVPLAARFIQRRFGIRYRRTRVTSLLKQAGCAPRGRVWVYD